MYVWKPKKKYNDEYNGLDVIIYYINSDPFDNIYIQKGTIKRIYESGITINIEEININSPTKYKYTCSLTTCFNKIKKIMVKDKEYIKNIKKVLCELLPDPIDDISDMIFEFLGEYVEI